jgi:ribosome-associated heat shock protein Hsp15
LSEAAGAVEALRLDKWLWHARFARTREAAMELVAARRVRLNTQVVTKTHALVRPGDVITLTQPARVRVLKVVALGVRRGQAADARGLYEELGDPA